MLQPGVRAAGGGRVGRGQDLRAAGTRHVHLQLHSLPSPTAAGAHTHCESHAVHGRHKTCEPTPEGTRPTAPLCVRL